MYFRDKDIAEFLGFNPSSITNVRKNKPKMYALYRIGFDDVMQNPDSKEWEKVKHKSLADHLDMCAKSISIMKTNQPKKYELLKRGFANMVSS